MPSRRRATKRSGARGLGAARRCPRRRRCIGARALIGSGRAGSRQPLCTCSDCKISADLPWRRRRQGEPPPPGEPAARIIDTLEYTRVRSCRLPARILRGDARARAGCSQLTSILRRLCLDARAAATRSPTSWGAPDSAHRRNCRSRRSEEAARAAPSRQIAYGAGPETEFVACPARRRQHVSRQDSSRPCKRRPSFGSPVQAKA